MLTALLAMKPKINPGVKPGLPAIEYAMYAEKTGIIIAIPALPRVFKNFNISFAGTSPLAVCSAPNNDTASITPPATTIGIMNDTPLSNAF